MNPIKRGVCMPAELGAWIYSTSRMAKVSENKVIVRMLEIAQEDVAPFDDAGLRRIFRDPWGMVKKYPALVRRIRKRSQARLSTTAATRLSLVDKTAFRELAKKQRTTVSAIQRQLVEGLVAREKLRT